MASGEAFPMQASSVAPPLWSYPLGYLEQIQSFMSHTTVSMTGMSWQVANDSVQSIL